MDAEYANYYTREVMLILIREFQSPDEEMKKIVLKVRLNIIYVNAKSLSLVPLSFGFFFSLHAGKRVLWELHGYKNLST